MKIRKVILAAFVIGTLFFPALGLAQSETTPESEESKAIPANEKLEELGIKVLYIGKELTDYIKEGREILTI